MDVSGVRETLPYSADDSKAQDGARQVTCALRACPLCPQEQAWSDYTFRSVWRHKRTSYRVASISHRHRWRKLDEVVELLSSSSTRRHYTVGDEHKVKDGALGCVGRNPQMAIMRFDNRAANRQAHTHTARFVVNSGLNIRSVSFCWTPVPL